MWEIDVVSYYLGTPYRLNELVRSPIGVNRSGKQFQTQLYDGKFYWKDYGYQSPHGHDIYALIVELEPGITSRDDAYEFAKAKGWAKGNSYKPKTVSIFDMIGSVKTPTVYEYDDLSYEHFGYYESLMVPEDVLHRFAMKKLLKIYKNDVVIFEHDIENYGFYWEFFKSKKGYMPFNYPWKGDKRIAFSHTAITGLEGLMQIDWTARDLWITKAMKDILCLVSCGFNTIGVSGEAMLKYLKIWMGYFLLKFERVIFWMDPDPAGYRLVHEMNRHYRGFYVCEGNPLIGKDPSDILLRTGNRFWINHLASKVIDSSQIRLYDGKKR